MVEAEVDHVDDDQQHEQGECCEDGDDQDQLQGEQPDAAGSCEQAEC